MVDNCPENIGAAGGVCVLLEVQRRHVYDEMARSGVRGDEMGNYVVSEEGGGEHASVSTEVPVQDQTRPRRIRYKPASKDIK